MKRKFKLIVPSFLTLIFCLLLIAGSTFAIFSSTDDASIEVTSGKVKMTADLTDLLAYSVEATDGTGNAGSAEAFGVTSNYNYVPAEEVVEHQSYRFANGGLVNFNEEKTLILSNVTPGDRITLKLTLTNDSNVDIKYRVRLNATEDNGLLEGLTFKMQEGTNDAEVFVGVIKVGNWTLWSAPANAAAKVKEINLELVLPVNAGNEYQEKTAKLRFTVEAVQANAKVDTLLEEVNAYLANETNQSAQVNKTMHDAKVEAEAYKPAFDATKYLWNIDTDQFYDPSNVVAGFENRFFKAYTESTMPAVAEQKYNIYATGEWTNPVNVVVGFDAGDATGISSVSYVRNGANDKAQEVVIRTNSAQTAITINAPKDIVHHYGVAGSLDIIAVAGQSYHENGTVGFIQIAKGRVALEKDSSVNQLHFDYNETAQKFDEIVVAVDSTVTLPKLSRDVVENIGANGTLVVELQDNTNAEQANSDYIWLYQQGLVEQIRISDSNESAGTVKATAYEETTNTYKAADDIANNLREGLSYDDLKAEDGSVPTQDLVGATIQNGGKTEQQKGQDKQAAITDVAQKVCLHVNKNYVSDGSTGHHAVCQDCGKVFVEIELHEFDSEDVPHCLKCNYVENIIKIKVSMSGTDNPDSVSETMSLSAAIQQYNEYNGEGKDFVIELAAGEYVMTPSGPNSEGVIINQNGVNAGRNLTIKALNMPSSVNDEFNVVIKSASVGDSELNGTSAFFQVDGNSSTNGGGIITFKGIKFDFTTSGATAGADYKFNTGANRRLAAVFLMAGGSRYAHDVTMELCQFHGPMGKFASAVNSTEHNSSPTRITIKDCKGDGMNSWFNGYQDQYGNLEDNYGVKLENLQSEHFLIVANPQGSGDVIMNNVNGSFLTVPGTSVLERWLVKFIHGVKLTIKDCNWDLCGNSPSSDGSSPNYLGVLIFVGNFEAHATISNFVVTRSGLTNKTTSQFPDIRLKEGARLSINDAAAFSDEYTSPYTVQLNNNN